MGAPNLACFTPLHATSALIPMHGAEKEKRKHDRRGAFPCVAMQFKVWVNRSAFQSRPRRRASRPRRDIPCDKGGEAEGSHQHACIRRDLLLVTFKFVLAMECREGPGKWKFESGESTPSVSSGSQQRQRSDVVRVGTIFGIARVIGKVLKERQSVGMCNYVSTRSFEQ